MYPQIFIDRELQERFDKQGFVIVKMADAKDVEYLSKLFDELHTNLPKEGFHSGSYSGDYSYKKKASDEIVKVLTPSFDNIFTNYQAFGASFLFKIPSTNSDLVIHQDWSVVDEDKSIALNCWIPLVDMNDKNGTLMVLPGVHYPAFKVLRAPTLNFFFTGNEDIVKKKLVPMYVKAGEAVVLNQSLVHYSQPNRSNSIRKAITAGVKTKGAPMHFYYKDMQAYKDELELFKMDENFLIKFDDFFKDIFQKPKNGVSLGKIEYKLPQPNRDELEQMLNTMIENSGFNSINKKRSLVRKIKELFS